MKRMPGSLLLMLGLACFLMACAARTSEPEATPISAPPGWELVWHDEFDGTAVDSANWTYDIGAGGWGNGEAEYYTARPENVRTENGLLIIEARQACGLHSGCSGQTLTGQTGPTAARSTSWSMSAGSQT
jgi:beta-glucanase (GH16 family)